MILHDFAYAEISFDGYKPPSILEVPGAKDAVEFTSSSKSRLAGGWRVGFACGNREMVGALARIKSYLDYACSRRSDRDDQRCAGRRTSSITTCASIASAATRCARG